MAPFFFTQTVAIFCSAAPSVAEIKTVLEGYDVQDFSTSPDVDLQVNMIGLSQVIISLKLSRWPDHMGSPETESRTFMQWSMGLFGGGAWPGALERAVRRCNHPDLVAAVREHQVYFLVRMKIHINSEGAIPDELDEGRDFPCLLKICARLLQLPGTSFFNPNSEILLLSLPEEDSPAFPLEALHSRRFSGIREGWLLAHSLGNAQLGLPDLEIVCRRDDFSDVEIKEWLASTTRNILPGLELKDGVKIPSPKGDLWALKCLEKGFHDTPPRPVIRLTQPGDKLPAIWKSGVYRRPWWRFWQT